MNLARLKKITKMEVMRGHQMARHMSTILPPITPLENEGLVAKVWIRGLSVPKKAVGSVTQELSTCKPHYEFLLSEVATDTGHLKLPPPV
jgi:hypothetical protein